MRYPTIPRNMEYLSDCILPGDEVSEAGGPTSCLANLLLDVLFGSSSDSPK